MVLIQIIVATVLIPLIFGPFANYLTHGGPNLLIISLWAFVWFTSKNDSLRFALMVGLISDLISFTFFGFWTIQLVCLVYLADFLKQKYLQPSSVIQSMIALVVLILASEIFSYAASSQINGWYFLTGIASSVILGGLVYYFLAVRLRLFSRWAGRRLS